MRKKILYALVFLAISCKKEVGKQAIDCHALAIGIIDGKTAVVKPIVDDLATDLRAKSTPSDSTGQKDNVTILVSRLNSNCSNLKATVSCYSCLYSLPPQSIVAVAVDSAGVRVTRSIIVWTPDNGVLTCANVD